MAQPQRAPLWQLTCLLMGLLASPATAEAPLSIIDWLETEEGESRQTVPPVTETAVQPRIEVRPLDAPATPVGLVPPSVTGLPTSLWSGSEPATLSRLITQAPVTRHPALQSLLYSMLLTEALPPSNPVGAEQVLTARIDKLLDLGAIDPAKALIEQAGPSASPGLFSRWTDMAFLTGTEDEICEVLAQRPHLAPNRETLIFCVARRGDLSRATLLFDTSLALDDLDPGQAPALDRFLHPELFEDAAPLRQPRQPGPLTFRLYEAIGERLPTTPLPRRFAVADLRDVAGWKAQLEAAERLARTGAIASNTLLGLYTERRPAASGGVWDRVAALQRFETALGTGSAEAVAKTLPEVWTQMQRAGLLTPFADLFAEMLLALEIEGPEARRRALELALLSPGYETLTRSLTPVSEQEQFWIALAQGAPSEVLAPSALSEAVSAGFLESQDLPRGLSRERLGETILRAIDLFDRGADGNLRDLSDALITFRSLGLEDVARRAALHLLIQQEG